MAFNYDPGRDPRLRGSTSGGSGKALSNLGGFPKAERYETSTNQQTNSWRDTTSTTQSLPLRSFSGNAQETMDSPNDPIPRRAPIFDRSQQLEADLTDEVEYIKGIGRVVYPRPRPPEPPPRKPPASRTDPLVFFLDEHHICTSGNISWEQQTRHFVFDDQNGVSVSFSADVIKRVDYVLGTARFVFSTDREDTSSPLFMFGLKETEVTYAMRFRSMVANYFAVSSQRCEEDINKMEAAIRRRYEKNLAPMKKDPWARDGGPAPRSMNTPEKPPNVKRLVERREPPKEKAKPRQRVLEQPSLPAFGRSSPPATQDVVMRSTSRQESNRRRPSYSPEASGRRRSSSPKPAAADTINVGDRCFRLRKPAEDVKSRSRFDDRDIYDGPFVVKSVLANQRVSARRCRDESPPDSNRDIKVKLDFHPESSADPWVSLGRLRKAYEVPPGTFLPTNKEVFEAAVAAAAAANRPNRAFTRQSFVAKLGPDHYVKGNLADPDSVGNGLYKIDRLRRKRIVIRSRREFPDEPANDRDLQSWLEEHRPLPPGQVPVVEYLVHWAGWPSEDDDWTRAHNNIPEAFIETFTDFHNQKTILPAWKD